MSTDPICVILHHGGSLSVDDSFVPTYTGGFNRPVVVPKRTSCVGLKKIVARALKKDFATHNINMICRFPRGNSYIASHLDEDDVCEAVLTWCAREPLDIYVEFEEIITDEPSTRIPVIEPMFGFNDGQFNSPSESAPVFPSARSTYERQNIVAVEPPTQTTEVYQSGMHIGSSSAQIHDSEMQLPRESMNDGYETMASASNSDSEESEAEDVEVDASLVQNDTIQGHDLIRRYSVRTINTEEVMFTSNDYIRACQTTQEWDNELNLDAGLEDANTMIENTIPNDLYDGMCFSTKQDLQFALNGWSILHNVEYKVVTSNKKKVTVKCVHWDDRTRPCLWRMHASCGKRLGGAWSISSMGAPHTCTHPVMVAGHRQCNSNFICHFLLPHIRTQIDLKPREIVGRIEAKFNVRVSYMKAWDARRKAIKKVFGSWEESYRSISRLMEAICIAMPGSVYRTQATKSHRFMRMFWAFGPSIIGWRFCRPVLSMDGTFLLGKYRGTLLTAIGIDANNGLYPLAFAVVESECNESWMWFLQSLNEMIPLVPSRRDLCIISDRHPGLVRGCREIFPWAAHRHCLRHLRENFKKTLRTMGISDVEFVCQKMYVAGNTDDYNTFKRYMRDIKNVKPEAAAWLIERDVSRWTLINDGGYRYGTMTTNAAECFNGVLKRARGLPIQALVMSIYYNIIGLFNRRHAAAVSLQQENESVFAPRIKNILQRYESEARKCPEPTIINRHEVQVFDATCRSFKVDILEDGECTCTCKRPEVYHLPCTHVIVAAGQRRVNHQIYVSRYYTLEHQRCIYAAEFHVIPERVDWPAFDTRSGIIPLDPPKVRRRTGRPRSRRFMNTMDEPSTSSSRICGLCKNRGHNRATCPRNPANLNA